MQSKKKPSYQAEKREPNPLPQGTRQRLRGARIELGLSVEKLGKLVGTSGATISRLENGKAGTDIKTLALLAIFLHDDFGMKELESFAVGRTKGLQAARLIDEMEERGQNIALATVEALYNTHRKKNFVQLDEKMCHHSDAPKQEPRIADQVTFSDSHSDRES